LLLSHMWVDGINISELMIIFNEVLGKNYSVRLVRLIKRAGVKYDIYAQMTTLEINIPLDLFFDWANVDTDLYIIM